MARIKQRGTERRTQRKRNKAQQEELGSDGAKRNRKENTTLKEQTKEKKKKKKKKKKKTEERREKREERREKRKGRRKCEPCCARTDPERECFSSTLAFLYWCFWWPRSGHSRASRARLLRANRALFSFLVPCSQSPKPRLLTLMVVLLDFDKF